MLFSTREDGVLVRRSRWTSPRRSLFLRLLELNHTPAMSAHPGGQRMYATILAWNVGRRVPYCPDVF